MKTFLRQLVSVESQFVAIVIGWVIFLRFFNVIEHKPLAGVMALLLLVTLVRVGIKQLLS